MSIVTNNTTDRLMVFIDLRNIMKGCSALTGLHGRVDYASAIEMIADGRKVAGAYVFDGSGSSDNDDKTEMMHRCLKYQGFRVRARDSYDSESRQQKEVDVDMACEILMQAVNDSYDTALILTGDRDFVPVIERIQSLGKKAEVAAFSVSMNKHLVRSADSFHCLDSMPVISMEAPADEVSDVLSQPHEAAEVSE